MARTTFRNVITTPDKINDINPQNQKLVLEKIVNGKN